MPSLLSLFFSLLLFSCTKTPSEILAQAGDHKLHLEEFSKRLKRKSQKLTPLETSLHWDKFKSEVLSEFIKEATLKTWARQKNLFVKKEDLEKRMRSLILPYKKKEFLLEALEKEALSWKDWKNQVYSSLLEELIFETITKKISAPSLKEMRTYYNSNKKVFFEEESVEVFQILTLTEKNAHHLRKLISRGSNFEFLAKKYSSALEAPLRGRVGRFHKSSAPFPFSVVFKMKPNEVSSPIKSVHGYHLIKRGRQRKARQKNFKEVEDQIKSYLISLKKRDRYETWLKKIMNNTKISINKRLLASIKLDYVL